MVDSCFKLYQGIIALTLYDMYIPFGERTLKFCSFVSSIYHFVCNFLQVEPSFFFYLLGS